MLAGYGLVGWWHGDSTEQSAALHWLYVNGSHAPGTSRPQNAESNSCALFSQSSGGRLHAAKTEPNAPLLCRLRCGEVTGRGEGAGSPAAPPTNRSAGRAMYFLRLCSRVGMSFLCFGAAAVSSASINFIIHPSPRIVKELHATFADN